MSPRPIRTALLMSACALALTGCGTRYVPWSPPKPEALLLPCKDPRLVPDPDAATSEEINVERIGVAKAYVDCRSHHKALADYVRGL